MYGSYLGKYNVFLFRAGGFLFSSCPQFLYLALSERPIKCRCHLSVQLPVTFYCLRPLDSLCKGLSVKSFSGLIPGESAQCLECRFFTHSSTLSLPAHAKIEIAGLGLGGGLFDPSLVLFQFCRFTLTAVFLNEHFIQLSYVTYLYSHFMLHVYIMSS
jgi:hypothetical protein